MSLFKKLQDSVESLYKDGVPLHHLDTARSIQPNNNTSSIFVSEYGDFVKLHRSTIQSIFRHCHILVLNVPTADMSFDGLVLGNVGNIYTPRRIFGEFLVFLACYWVTEQERSYV